MYISFITIDPDGDLGLLKSPCLLSSLWLCATQRSIILVHILIQVVWLQSMYMLCHMIYAH